MNVSKNQQPRRNDTLGSLLTGTAETQNMPRILLAEGCPVTAISTKELLQQYGYEVTVEDNGNAALKTLSASDFDFVLMDLEMPVMDGFEACRRLRSGLSDCINPSVPVIGMSTNPTSLLRTLASQLGMRDVLEKPLDFDVLTNMLRSLDVNTNTAENRHKTLAPAFFDKEAALNRLAGDATLYQKLLRQLRDILPQKNHTLDAAIIQEDFDTIEITAHSLAGSFGSVGALQCMREAKKLCLSARSHERHALKGRYQKFQNALEQFLDFVDNESI